MRAPFILGCVGDPDKGPSRGGEDDRGVFEDDPGVDTSPTVLDPLVAAIDGDDGGSGERVK